MRDDDIHFGSDDPEMIEQCLHCTKPECVNCFERTHPPKQPWSIYKVYQIHDGKVIQTFPTIADAARITCVSEQTIRRCIAGKQKTGGGFQWKRAR